MSIFNNALHGGKISNAVNAEHHNAAGKARLMTQYYIGFGVVAAVLGLLIGLSLGGVI